MLGYEDQSTSEGQSTAQVYEAQSTAQEKKVKVLLRTNMQNRLKDCYVKDMIKIF